MLLEKANLKRDALAGKVALVTGAGGGIGYETARALAYLGAKVIIAEIDKSKGASTAQAINGELQSDSVCFFHVDLAEKTQLDALCTCIANRYEALDILIHNATITPLGAIDTVPLSQWDNSYAVNLRAPVYLTRQFLPGMKKRNSGTVVFVSSSGAAPFMGAYEVFKTAQVELCSTLAGELEGTDVITYTVGPGLVKTETAQREIEKVAAWMGLSVDEFYEMNNPHILDVESAGAGFALSVLHAPRYSGQEISCIQVLREAGFIADADPQPQPRSPEFQLRDIAPRIRNMARIFDEQHSGWMARNVFERQWVLRDFKKTVGMSADNFQKQLESALHALENSQWDKVADHRDNFEKLKDYFSRQHKLLQGFEKNPAALKKNSQMLLDWIEELQLIVRGLA